MNDASNIRSGLLLHGHSDVVVAAVIPCLNEEGAIFDVVARVRRSGVAEVIVVDGGSCDHTVERACAAGAKVISETRPGYGLAVQAGVAAVRADADILLFLDGDGSDRTEFIPALLNPIINAEAAFVQGSRLRGAREDGSLTLQQVVAGRIAGLLLRSLYGVRFTDISPFRAIRRDLLSGLEMREASYGWNLEMLMRVAASGAPVLEIAVGQRRRRGGASKVSGRLGAGLRAGIVIAVTFMRLALSLRHSRRG